jgi:tRNA threonylcarbamoyladenosine biosynthesis protein TsaB
MGRNPVYGIISHVRILGLETSSSAGSVALLEKEHLVGERILPSNARSAQSLAPALAALFAEVGWRAQDVQLIAVTQGPGSFTGLRVGAATAKVLAYSLRAELLGVNTLEVLASQTEHFQGEVWTLLDAHRGQLFAAFYRCDGGQVEAVVPAHIVSIEDWLRAYVVQQAITGPGLCRIASQLPCDAKVIDTESAIPRAAWVGRVAYRHYQQGQRDDVWSFTPRYYRPSAAEEKCDATHDAS